MTTILDITKTDNTLYNEYNSDLMQEVNASFTPEERDLYILNFMGYMKYDNEKDHIVDFDQAYKMIGYERKSHAKTMLENNFTKDVDYIIKLSTACAVEETKDKNTKERYNKETILLTINCFKAFCLYARTDKAKQIHKYYIKLENIFNKVIKNQAMKFQKQLQDSQKQIEIVLSQKEQNLCENFSKKHIIYLGSFIQKVGKNAGKEAGKPGWTDDIERRLKDLKRDLGQDFTFIYVHESRHNIEIERQLFKKPIMVKARFEDVYNGHNYTELFNLDSTLTIKYINKLIHKIKNEVEASDNSKERDGEINQLKVENKQLRLDLIEQIRINKELNTDLGIIEQNYNYVYIELNPSGTNLHRIVASEEEVKNPLYLFTYKTPNASKIMTNIKLYMEPYNQDMNSFIIIEYHKIKQLVDFCILTYDHYKINTDMDNLVHFIGRYNTGRLTNSNKARVVIERKIYEDFIKEKTIIGPTEKVTCGMLCDYFYDWYKQKFNTNSNDLTHMKSLQGEWRISFRDEFMKEVAEITKLKYQNSINICDKDRGLNYANCAGFTGIGIKNIVKINYYEEDLYRKYVDKFIKVSDNIRHKVARKEILDHFTSWVTENKLYNPKSMKQLYAPSFIVEVTEIIEKITGIKFEPRKTKPTFPGIFTGMTHSQFDCIMNGSKE